MYGSRLLPIALNGRYVAAPTGRTGPSAKDEVIVGAVNSFS